MDLSIIIPVYNSENIIEELVKQLNDSVSNISYINSFEIIMINDFSSDKSWEKIKSISKKFEFIKGISFAQNYGQHNAIMVGLEACDGEKVITMDDDGQNSPKYIVDLCAEINKGRDVCYANYLIKKHHFLRILGSKINNFFVTLLFSKPLNLYLTSFRCITHNIKDEIIKNKSPSIYLDGLILSITRNISKISVIHNDRKFGRSNYSFIKLLKTN